MRKLNLLFAIFIFSLILRLALIPLAHHGDLNNNISWGEAALQRGLSDYYEGSNWDYSAPNQPPLYILTFAATSLIYQTTDSLIQSLNTKISFFPSQLVWIWEKYGIDFTAKLPGVLADLGIAYLIYYYFAKKEKQKTALALSSVWLVNPVTLYSSSIWGQTDSLVNLLGLLAVLSLLRKNIVLSLLFMTMSVLFKGSLVIFIPLLIVVMLQQRHPVVRWFQAVVASLIAIFIISIWFHPQVDFLIWLFNLYIQRFFPGEIGYLTANAFNLWWLIDPGKILDSTIFFGVSARILGLVLTAIIIIYILFRLRKKVYDQQIFLALGLIALAAFLFMTRIHERYLYPFFPMATLSLGFYRKLMPVYIGLSLLHLANLYHEFWAPSILPIEIWYKSNWQQIGNFVSIITLLFFVYLLYQFLILKQNKTGE